MLCSFQKRFATFSKYLQRDQSGLSHKVIESARGGMCASTGRYSLCDEDQSGVVTVTVTVCNLTLGDAGGYRCCANTRSFQDPCHMIWLDVHNQSTTTLTPLVPTVNSEASHSSSSPASSMSSSSSSSSLSPPPPSLSLLSSHTTASALPEQSTTTNSPTTKSQKRDTGEYVNTCHTAIHNHPQMGPSVCSKANITPGTGNANLNYANNPETVFFIRLGTPTPTEPVYQPLCYPTTPADTDDYLSLNPATAVSSTGQGSPLYLSLDSHASLSDTIYDSLQ
ncbi:putative protein TPRXL [Alosa sapidissima]|uniref:putative protein TPRXL n=1 Tax=Alosa sapidissima TaxID=34773 RepID=UPI001C0913BE|nr:putative protein TPRXL [Alosa sapidissima]XP_041961266.1 putative protein TPRXL [Alosa sapidissima]XP_041961267.1 putative protein TPRXL [Alosa sapidissima]